MGILDFMFGIKNKKNNYEEIYSNKKFKDVKERYDYLLKLQFKKGINTSSEREKLVGQLNDIQLQEVIDREPNSEVKKKIEDRVYFKMDRRVSVNYDLKNKNYHNIAKSLKKIGKDDIEFQEYILGKIDENEDALKYLISHRALNIKFHKEIIDQISDVTFLRRIIRDKIIGKPLYKHTKNRITELGGDSEVFSGYPDVRWLCFKNSAECPNCKNNTPIYNFDLKQKCNYCMKEYDLPKLFGSSAYDYYNEFAWYLSNYHEDISERVPVCIKCEAALDTKKLEKLKAGESITCNKCGMLNESSEVPELMKEVTGYFNENHKEVKYKPKAILLPKKKTAELDDGEKKIIGFKCPNCSANLKVNSETPRVLHCEYCESDQFIPDSLWEIFHPVPILQPVCIKWEKQGNL